MATLTEEVRVLLAEPRETVTLDYKERLDWGRTGGKIELARDIVCLANRSGGLLIVGVRDHGGSLEILGLPDAEHLPDTTEVAQGVARYFDPPPAFECTEIVVDGLRFGVIRVDEFRRTPHIVSGIANDATDTRRYSPFHQTYTATSGTDLMAVRECDTTAIVEAKELEQVAKEIVRELAWYFGYDLTDEAWDAHMVQTREWIPGL